MLREKLKAAIAAGGTGGHIYPGLAVADEIISRFPGADILFIGSEEGMEKGLVPRAGFKLALIKSRALLRKISYKSLSAPFVTAFGFLQSLFILLRFKPDFLFSTGGYAGLPVILAAKLLKIPIYLHEQNVLPGITNRICGRFAAKVFLSFEETKKFLPGEVTGNPVRREILAAKRQPSASGRRTILVLGGSQGSRKINQTVLASLDKFPAGRFEILHIIGARDFGLARGGNHDFYHPFSYLYNMGETLAAADLVVSRAGATAIAEFLVRELPMILVPFPYSAESHQDLNARVIEEAGCGIVVPEKNFTSDRLIDLLQDEKIDWEIMGKNCRRIAKPEAAAGIVGAILGKR